MLYRKVCIDISYFSPVIDSAWAWLGLSTAGSSVEETADGPGPDSRTVCTRGEARPHPHPHTRREAAADLEMYSFNEMQESQLQTLLSSSGQMVSIQMSKQLRCIKRLRNEKCLLKPGKPRETFSPYLL